MRILFITRSFAPDSSIASKRITMLVKHLAGLGYDISVIRSGCIFGKPDRIRLEGLENVHIISYNGENTPADRFDRGEPYSNNNKALEDDKHSKKRTQVYLALSRVIHMLVLDPLKFYIKDGWKVYKNICKSYNQNKQLRNFDIIFSTFPPIGCLQAGRFIKQKENAKWIVDFRDLMDNAAFTPLLRFLNKRIQIKYLNDADICLCVSEGNTKRLAELKNGKFVKKIQTVYNGYEASLEKNTEPIGIIDNFLHISYTGAIYGFRDASPLFLAIKSLGAENKIKIDYAGHDCSVLKQQAAKYGIEEIVIDHGYLTSTEVMKMQNEMDLFLVLSWNTRQDQGILTGKFYEALQCKKPVIALVQGNKSDSELKRLIDKYRLGFCYEEATKEQSEESLRHYLENQIKQKEKGLTLEYDPDQSVFGKFEYSSITKGLESIMKGLIS